MRTRKIRLMAFLGGTLLLVCTFVATSRESKTPDGVIHRPTQIPDRVV